LIGRKYDDPLTQSFLQHVPCPVSRGPNGEILFEVNYLGQKHHLSIEQITAAFLVKLKMITESQLGSRVVDCVISVPPYFTDVQRQSLLQAGHIAGLNVLNIVNEDVAVGIAYGIYKKGQLPAPTEKHGKLVAFVDVGHSATCVSLMEFHERQV
jgi:molecular chaperone DnaK (HSP70)